MNSSTSESARLNERRIRAEAGAWIAKLHGLDRTLALEEALRQWLAENPLHAREFELATDVWNDSGHLPAPARPVPERSRLRLESRFLRPVIAVAVGCLIVLGLFTYPWNDAALTTRVGEQKIVTLVDGTRVTLNTDSRLLLHYDKKARTVELKSGEAFFDVAHDVRWPFVVEAGDRKIIAMGTSFIVRRTDQDKAAVTVTLLEGRVAVAPLTTPDVLPAKLLPEVILLTPRERLRTSVAQRPMIERASADESTGWMRGELMFAGTPLHKAAEEFNRYNAVKIKIGSAELANIPVGGVFRISDSISFARAVAESHGLRLIARDEEILLDR